jgi:hypothetical protein
MATSAFTISKKHLNMFYVRNREAHDLQQKQTTL